MTRHHTIGLVVALSLLTSACTQAPSVESQRSPLESVPDNAQSPIPANVSRHVAAERGLGDGDVLQISEGDRCPVCAMLPAKQPKNAAAIVLNDGTTYYFCGTGCMIRSWMHPDVYLGTEKDHLHKAIVQEYFDGKPIDARQATWVAGSDVVGPMGPALVGLSNEEDAKTFEERHGSKHRFLLDEMDDARWTEVTGKPAIRPK
jgi:copper chaperone NosL